MRARPEWEWFYVEKKIIMIKYHERPCQSANECDLYNKCDKYRIYIVQANKSDRWNTMDGEISIFCRNLSVVLFRRRRRRRRKPRTIWGK